MDTMPSSEFRRRYATLTQPTIVTVNGHTIGRWMPGIPANDAVDVGGVPDMRPIGLRPVDLHPRFNSRGSRPVPKR